MLKDYTQPEITVLRFRLYDILTDSDWFNEDGTIDDGKGGGPEIDGPDAVPVPTFTWGE